LKNWLTLRFKVMAMWLKIMTRRADAVAFLEGRYRAKYEDQGVAVDVIQAVQALAPKSPLDFDKRVTAVNHFRTLPEAAALAAANKRVANILAKKQHLKVC
jgi:glycyl-tRNA synthetase beta chain